MSRRLHAQPVPGWGVHRGVYGYPLETCEERDPKGLYRKARVGDIRNFAGIDSPYERPRHAEVTLDTSTLGVEACVELLIGYMLERGLILGKG